MKYHYFFSDSQIEQIREGALAILEQIGIKVSRSELLEQLVKKGFRVDGNYVKVERGLALKKILTPFPDAGVPKSARRILTTWTSCYPHTYETVSGAFEPITKDSNLAMGIYAANVAEIWPNLMPSCPGHPTDLPPDVQFLRQMVNSFLCCKNFGPMEPVSPKIADYHFAICDTMGVALNDLPVYVASPLNLAGESFDIALRYCSKVGYVWFNSMPSLGANTPLNLIGAYAQTLAETAGSAVIFEELTGVKTNYRTSIFTFDFRDMSMPFGTPEKFLLESTNMEVRVRVSGGEYTGPGYTDIHTNAIRCGIQAAMEKASLATAGAMLGSYIFACSGTLGMDETFSPVQLLLDLELLDHIQKLVDGMPVDDFEGDLVEEVREGLKSGYIMTDRTLDNMGRYVWPARFFTRKSFGVYQNQPFKLEVEKAADMASDLMKKKPSWMLDDDRAKELERIFASAVKIL